MNILDLFSILKFIYKFYCLIFIYKNLMSNFVSLITFIIFKIEHFYRRINNRYEIIYQNFILFRICKKINCD